VNPVHEPVAWSRSWLGSAARPSGDLVYEPGARRRQTKGSEIQNLNAADEGIPCISVVVFEEGEHGRI
jgi:hypothetical protein